MKIEGPRLGYSWIPHHIFKISPIRGFTHCKAQDEVIKNLNIGKWWDVGLGGFLHMVVKSEWDLTLANMH